jgi:lysophospholipase L1-like esterase
MDKKIVGAYFILLHVLLAIVLTKSDFIERSEKKLRAIAAIPPFEDPVPRHHRRMEASIPDGAIVFLGDSIIQGMYVSALDPLSVNFGASGLTSDLLLERLPHYQTLERARLAVVAIGINDIRRRSNAEILSTYVAILERIPEHLPVVFSAVLPVNEHVRPGQLRRSNEQIRKLNRDLRRLCREHSARVTCFDAGPRLVNGAGQLAHKYHEGDGLHLSAKGYEVWMDALRLAIAEATTPRSTIAELQADD